MKRLVVLLLFTVGIYAQVQAPDEFQVVMHTTKGNVLLEIQRRFAPLGVDRFYALVKSKFYNGAMIFRVVPGFVAQFGINGNPEIDSKWINSEIQDDPVLLGNKKGCIAFATDGPNTRTTQLFINLEDNPHLDERGFAAFGKVIQGMKAVQNFDSTCTEKEYTQDEIYQKGNEYLKSVCPYDDVILKMEILEERRVGEESSFGLEPFSWLDSLQSFSLPWITFPTESVQYYFSYYVIGGYYYFQPYSIPYLNTYEYYGGYGYGGYGYGGYGYGGYGYGGYGYGGYGYGGYGYGGYGYGGYGYGGYGYGGYGYGGYGYGGYGGNYNTIAYELDDERKGMVKVEEIDKNGSQKLMNIESSSQAKTPYFDGTSIFSDLWLFVYIIGVGAVLCVIVAIAIYFYWKKEPSTAEKMITPLPTIVSPTPQNLAKFSFVESNEDDTF